MVHRQAALLLLLTGALLAPPLAAQRPRGAAIQANNLPGVTYGFPQVAATPGGDFVAIWQSGGYDLPAQTAHVWVRLFRADGTAKAKQIRVSTSPADEVLPRVAVGADGSFVVVWQSGPYRDTSVFGRRFGADGAPRGPRFRLSSQTKGFQTEPAVAVAADGSFVATWTSEGHYDLPNVWARRFDPAGQPLGPDFRVNVTTDDEREAPQVAMSANGDFVIGWASWNGDGAFFDVMVRRFAKDSTPLTDELMANLGGAPTASQYEFALGMAPDGAFVVLWTDPGAEDGGTDIGVLGQRFAANGDPIGPSFHVDGSPQGVQDEPAVAVAADGSFVALWRSYASYDSPGPYLILSRRFASDGRPLGSETLADPSVTSRDFLPAVALGRDGQGLALWARYRDGVFARRLVP